jgi:phosphomannomutase
VRTATTTDMLAKMGAHYGLHVETTPVGFKHIASKMVEGDVLVGGEESGGLAVKGHIPERDGIFIGLLVVEMMVKRGKKLSELVDELFEQFGPHHAYRSDIHTSEEKKQRFLKMLAQEGVKEAAGFKVVHLDTIDGYKFRTEADNWVMIRASGTEPVLRIYSEAADPETAKRLVDSVAALI